MDSGIRRRLDRLAALARLEGRRTDDIGSMSDVELAAIVAEGTGYSAAEVLNLSDAELQALVEGESDERQSTP